MTILSWTKKTLGTKNRIKLKRRKKPKTKAKARPAKADKAGGWEKEFKRRREAWKAKERAKK